jgi:hypothetical protein
LEQRSGVAFDLQVVDDVELKRSRREGGRDLPALLEGEVLALEDVLDAVDEGPAVEGPTRE